MLEWFNPFIFWILNPWNFLSVVMSAVALVGTIMNAERNKWGFACWLVSNMYMCINFFILGAYAQSILFFVYFLLAIRGTWVWNEKEKRDIIKL